MEYGFVKLAEIEEKEELSENATVIVEDGGEIYRKKAGKIGGSDSGDWHWEIIDINGTEGAAALGSMNSSMYIEQNEPLQIALRRPDKAKIFFYINGQAIETYRVMELINWYPLNPNSQANQTIEFKAFGLEDTVIVQEEYDSWHVYSESVETLIIYTCEDLGGFKSDALPEKYEESDT